ncbi:MAG: hypothetical protein ACRENG_20470 [bacterium]
MSQNHNIVSAAEDLIQEQFELEPSLEQVIWIDADKPAEIRLLEINPETPATGSVMSFYFPPVDEFPYATKIAEIRPEEWQKILRHEIPLPRGWTLENYKVYSREAITV